MDAADDAQPDAPDYDPPADEPAPAAEAASAPAEGTLESSALAEVHAAAILAAKDLLLTRPEMPQLTSDTAALTVGMHAAIIFRAYREFLQAPDLLPPPLQGR